MKRDSQRFGAHVPTSNRRSWLVSAGVAGALWAGGRAVRSSAQLALGLKPGMTSARRFAPGGGLSVVLLGTGTPLVNPDRACAATLVIAGDKTFLVDTGRGFLTRLADAGLRDVSLVLFTHYHSDHFGEFGELMVTRGIAGADRPLPVIGPAGVKEVIGSLLAAYSLDERCRRAHHGGKWSEAAMRAELMEKTGGVVYEAGGVKITMFEVDHPPVTPAVGYRFDYQGKSVVVSGDTKKCERLAAMARGCDVLVHEAASKSMTETAVKLMRRAGGTDNERMATMAEEMLTYHTMTEEAAEVAAEAGVKKLVLTHLAPALPENPAVERLFVAGMSAVYRGPIIVGRDGLDVKA